MCIRLYFENEMNAIFEQVWDRLNFTFWEMKKTASGDIVVTRVFLIYVKSEKIDFLLSTQNEWVKLG